MSMSYKIPNGADIRRLRKLMGLSQAKLAKFAGLSQSLIARIETGSVDPRLSTMKKILNALLQYRQESSKGIVKEVLEYKKASDIPQLVFVFDNDTVNRAVFLMKKYDVSQLPVLNEAGNNVGCVTEGVVIRNLFQLGEKVLDLRVGEIMEHPLPEVQIDDKIDKVYSYLISGAPAVLVLDGSKTIGILTKIDVISYQQRKTKLPEVP
ncbi:MAG: CBS domain-containing protein [Candidatus Asgardarchaeia archaeon]